MKTSDLIKILSESLEMNGDLNVVGMVDGVAYEDIEVNCPDEWSPMYLELYRKN